jgi:quercetin dioxygenase-like cupin family protein
MNNSRNVWILIGIILALSVAFGRMFLFSSDDKIKYDGMDTVENYSSNTIFPQGDKASADYFTGTAWVKLLVPNDTVSHCQIGNVVFEPGARNNWHTHPGGQILMVTDGVGYYQEKGKPVHVIRKGDVVNILPNVEHWHGASADSSMTHIAVNANTQNGIVTWLEKVTDDEYHAIKK